jgi:hypothetical protein
LLLALPPLHLHLQDRQHLLLLQDLRAPQLLLADAAAHQELLAVLLLQAAEGLPYLLQQLSWAPCSINTSGHSDGNKDIEHEVFDV